MTLHDMRSDLWYEEESGNMRRVCSVPLQVNKKTLTWSFQIPEEYDFEVSKIKIIRTIFTNPWE